MLTDEFPDPNDADLNLDAPCPEFGWPNFVSSIRSRAVNFPEHEGTLSIKCAFDGQEIYEVEGERFTVHEKSYLILNAGQRYASQIESDRDIESFCIFFRPDFAGQVLRGLSLPDDCLLDDPIDPGPGTSLLFIEKLYHHDLDLSPLLFGIRRAVHSGHCSKTWLEEQFHQLLERMLVVHRKVRDEVQLLPARRRRTRVEIYRRLHRARDFMHACYAEDLNLQLIAASASLSVHHFLRLFKQVFHETPHQYLTRIRIEQARHLLLTTQLSISSICFDVGFESLSSFSWLFKKRLGLSPERYRLEHSAPTVFSIR